MESSGFSKLLTRKVPHIHEKILLSLDYETFMNCQGVCKTWDKLLVAESFRKKAYSLYSEEMDHVLVKNCISGNAGHVKRLLLRGANPNCISKYFTHKLPPLIWSVWTVNIDVTKILLDHGADINGATENGLTPLLWITGVCNCPLDMVTLLLEGGADPKKASKSGTTPLHSAVLKGTEVVKALLEHGGYTDGADDAGQTPLGIATAMGNDKVIKLIQNAAPSNPN